jgi:hypothetical protein
MEVVARVLAVRSNVASASAVERPGRSVAAAILDDTCGVLLRLASRT